MSSAVTRPSVDAFVAALSPVLEADQLQIGELPRFTVDEMTPAVAGVPDSLVQLQQILAEAHKSRLSVIAIGGGTHLGAGNFPTTYDVALLMARMNRVIAHEPADLTVTVEPGVRLHDLQEQLAAHGQRLPLDPPCGGEATVAGVLAVNASGPMRHAYGTARDWLIGARVVHADGSTSKSGGRVVKNVTGYDMHKLHVGALGSLGVIAEATFKLVPLPPRHADLSIAFESARAASALILDAHDAGLSLQAAELLSPTAAHGVVADTRWHVIARVAGGARGIDRTLREIDRLVHESGAHIDRHEDGAIWERWSGAFAPCPLAIRVIVMPSAVAVTVEALDRVLAGAAARVSATVAAGLIRVNVEPSSDARAAAMAERVRDVAERNDGTMIVDAAPVALKRAIDVFGPLRSDFAIMKRLKEQFDPQGVLSPGRFAGRL
jgi:glycolate oxidase FAD binding subunit